MIIFTQFINKDLNEFCIQIKTPITQGVRQEGPYPNIHLKNHILTFDYLPKFNLHPDILALLCLVSFYPFCFEKNSTSSHIRFPQPVSPKFQKIIQEIIYVDETSQSSKKNIIVDNIDTNLLSYGGWIKGNPNSTSYSNSCLDNNINNNNINNNDKKKRNSRKYNKKSFKHFAISYGGGLDSTVAMILYPHARVIHEKRYGHLDQTHNWLRDKDHRYYSIESNNKDLTNEPGWTSWISCTSTSLLMASDLKLKGIILGSSLGSVYLNNGKKYFAAHQRKFMNQWFRIFSQTGIPLIIPLAGFSDQALANLLVKLKPELIGKLNYCLLGPQGSNCHRCWKCFRRDLVISLAQTDYSWIDWTQYHKSKILKNSEKGPYTILKMGPSFIYSIMKSSQDLPWLQSYAEVLKDYLQKRNISLDWLNGFYYPSLQLMPSDCFNIYAKPIFKIIKNGIIHPLTQEEQIILESWNI